MGPRMIGLTFRLVQVLSAVHMGSKTVLQQPPLRWPQDGPQQVIGNTVLYKQQPAVQ